MTSTQLAHVTKFYGFVATCSNPMTTRLGKMVDQHALILHALIKSMTVSTKLGHVANDYEFISTSIRPITSKLNNKGDHYALNFPCNLRWGYYNYFMVLAFLNLSPLL